MTMLNFLQAHTLEEILENDIFLNKICFELDIGSKMNYDRIVYIINSDEKYVDFKSFSEYHFSSICKKHKCKHFEDNDYDDLRDMYDCCYCIESKNYYDELNECISKQIKRVEFSCPFEDEHKKIRKKYVKKFLLEELAE